MTYVVLKKLGELLVFLGAFGRKLLPIIEKEIDIFDLAWCKQSGNHETLR